MCVLTYGRVCSFIALYDLLPIVSLYELDKGLGAYAEIIWGGEGEPRGWANDALVAVQYFLPRAKPKLGLAWNLAAAWGIQ